MVSGLPERPSLCRNFYINIEGFQLKMLVLDIFIAVDLKCGRLGGGSHQRFLLVLAEDLLQGHSRPTH